MLTDEEKIQRAKEIYYKRNGINFRGEEKKKKHNKLFFIIIIISLVGVYLYQNQAKYFTQENKEKIKDFLNTKININEFIKQNNKVENDIKNETENLIENITNSAESIEEKDVSYSVIWPKKGTITSYFGKRESEDARVGKNHTGIDIAGEEGEEILSAITGQVTLVSEEGDLGKHIKIKNDEYETVYAHCSQIYAEAESNIKQGDVIAAIGSTGNSTGNHLHFEVLKNGEYIDPLKVIEK